MGAEDAGRVVGEGVSWIVAGAEVAAYRVEVDGEANMEAAAGTIGPRGAILISHGMVKEVCFASWIRQRCYQMEGLQGSAWADYNLSITNLTMQVEEDKSVLGSNETTLVLLACSVWGTHLKQ